MYIFFSFFFPPALQNAQSLHRGQIISALSGICQSEPGSCCPAELSARPCQNPSKSSFLVGGGSTGPFLDAGYHLPKCHCPCLARSGCRRSLLALGMLPVQQPVPEPSPRRANEQCSLLPGRECRSGLPWGAQWQLGEWPRGPQGSCWVEAHSEGKHAGRAKRWGGKLETMLGLTLSARKNFSHKKNIDNAPL